MRSFIAALLAAACALASPLAAANNWSGLFKNGPAEFFDDEDMQIFLATARKALDGAAVNQTVSWENPKSKNRGDFTVLKQFEWKANTCREVRVRNEAQGRKSDNAHNLCKVDGRWRLVAPSQLKAK
jgi:surface antigen